MLPLAMMRFYAAWQNGSLHITRFLFPLKIVSAPAHGIHPPERLLFLSPKVFRRILRISQRGLFWLRGGEKKSEHPPKKEPQKVLRKVSEEGVWGCYEPTQALSFRECGRAWRKWQRVREYYRELERD